MAQADQGLWARSALSPEEGKCGCERAESQTSLQQLANCAYYWRRVQRLSVVELVIVQHHHHTHLEKPDHCCTKER
jgi:hypothetical protein